MKRPRAFSGPLFYVIFVVVGALVAVELATPLVLRLRYGRWISRAEIVATLGRAPQAALPETLAARDEARGGMRDNVLHPYLGYVRDYALERQVFNRRSVDETTNGYGFFGPEPPRRASPETRVVAIAGGSVATELYLYGRDTLRAELSTIPAYAGKELVFVSLALGGMKQPQQLLALGYLLALGHHFDLVINLDGFNEAALPYAENLPAGVFPFYPRAWQLYATKTVDVEAMAAVGGIALRRRQLERRRARLAGSPLRHSRFILALWHGYHQRQNAAIEALDGALRARLAEGRALTPQETGPPYAGDADTVFADSAAVWREASLQMARLCAANNVAYHHFLQPNQYLPGSKPLSDEEKRVALAGPETPYRRGVERGYPLLVATGRELAVRGVAYVDLTGLFAARAETLYRDRCCHLNDRGYELLAAAVAAGIKGSRPG